VRRYLALLRYHRTSQLARRALSVARQKSPRVSARHYAVPGNPVPRPRTSSNFSALLSRKIAFRDAKLARQNANAVLEGRFRFLNDERTLPDPINWRREEGVRCQVSGVRIQRTEIRGQRSERIENRKSKIENRHQLWRFQLHSQDYLLDLIAASARNARKGDRTLLPERPFGCFAQKGPVPFSGDPFSQRAWAIVEQWIEGNSEHDRRVWNDAWHPYCISRRLPIWILLYTAAPRSDPGAERTFRSIYQQAVCLERHLERDLGGNHLLENLKALLVAGVFFEGPDAERWLSKGSRLIQREISEQVLTSGEHFERSPMYHCHVLELLMDVADVVQEHLPELARACRDATDRMSEFLAQIVHPDGEIPLLGDSCFGEATSASVLILEVQQPHTQREEARVGRISKVVSDLFGVPSYSEVGGQRVALTGRFAMQTTSCCSMQGRLARITCPPMLMPTCWESKRRSAVGVCLSTVVFSTTKTTRCVDTADPQRRTTSFRLMGQISVTCGPNSGWAIGDIRPDSLAASRKGFLGHRAVTMPIAA